MTEHFSFTSRPEGLLAAWEHALSLRAHGWKTRLAERNWRTSNGFNVVTVVATPPKRPTRTERGCFVGNQR